MELPPPPDMLLENDRILKIAGSFPQSSRQMNERLISDAELIHIGNHQILAVTVDSISESIQSGLYDDPYQIGWLAVTVNLSKLAAVGAHPIGINILLNLKYETDSEFCQSIWQGIMDACRQYGITVLGADTKRSLVDHIGGSPLGMISDGNTIMPTGARVGDWLFASDWMGFGGFHAYQKFLGNTKSVPEFFPKARIKEGKIIRQFGSSCTDTGEGFFPAVSKLCNLNSLGFKLNLELEEIVAPWFRTRINNSGIPPWTLLAGPHGEFELLFTIPNRHLRAFDKASRAQVWSPLKLGKAVRTRDLDFLFDGKRKHVNPDDISNLYHNSGLDLKEYLKGLLKLSRSWRQ